MEKTESNPMLSLDNNYLKQLKKDVNSIIVGSDDDLQIIEAVVILIEKLQNGVETEKKEGNPVSQLNKRNIENIMKGLAYYKAGYSCDDRFQSTIDNTISKIQKDVETNNGQPILCTDCDNIATIITEGIQCCTECYNDALKGHHDYDCKCVIHR